MPNWCQNQLTVTGSKEDVLKFREDHENFSFNVVVKEEGDIKDDNYDWYKWRLANWGTKWDVEDQLDSIYIDENFTRYNFDTAWSPPTKWLKQAGLKYPNIEFNLKYQEAGCGFEGVAFANGAEFTDDTRDFVEPPSN